MGENKKDSLLHEYTQSLRGATHTTLPNLDQASISAGFCLDVAETNNFVLVAHTAYCLSHSLIQNH